MRDAQDVTVFLSYARSDHRSREIADQVLRVLGENGVTAWDDRMIEPGSNWAELVDEALSHARMFVLMIPPESQRSARLYFDIGAAVARATEAPDEVRLIPILVHGDGRSELPRRLMRWSAIDSADLPVGDVAEEIGKAVLRWEERSHEKARA